MHVFAPIRSLVCLLVLTAGASAQQNVLILLADDLGVDNVAVYQEGVAPPPTPNIDALAAGGVLFRNAWGHPVCSATRAGLLTGRYALRTGVGNLVLLNGPPVLRLAETILPELLDAQQSGHAHAAIGKWHLGNAINGGELGPNLAGWSHYAGLLGGETNYFQWPRTVDGQTATSTVYTTTQMVDDALAWMQSVPEPWVCYLALNAPHKPFHAPPAALHTQDLQGKSPATEPIPFYKAMVEAMDTEIGRLLTTLGPEVVSRTNVFFVGDNGTPGEVSEAPFLPGHAKTTLFEGGINVPLIVAGPAVQSPGREEAALITTVDVFATVAEVCGVDPVVPYIKLDSVSLLPLLRAPGLPSLRSSVYTESFGTWPNPVNAVAIRDGTHKLIRDLAVVPAVDQLFDLVNDPFEQSDLMAGPLTGPQQATYDALVAEVDVIRDLSGSFTNYGEAACVGSNGKPSISSIGIPQLGATYTVRLENGPPNRPVLLFAGSSRKRWGNVELPLPLSQLGGIGHMVGLELPFYAIDPGQLVGGAGCFVYASGEVVALAITTEDGTASVEVTLGNDPSLISGATYHTWMVSDHRAPNNPMGITFSDAAVAIVGGT